MSTDCTRVMMMSAATAAVILGSGCQVLGGIEGTRIEDSGADAAPDAPPGPQAVSIAELRALRDGPVDALLEDVVVTYIGTTSTNSRFFLQDQVQGPAIQVFLGAAAPPVAVGNQISVHARSLVTFAGSRQVDEFDITANDGGQVNVLLQLAQDISAGDGRPPDPDMESELALVRDARLVTAQPDGLTYTVEYGGNVSAPVRATLFSEGAQELGLCPGARFDLLAVVTPFMGNFQLRAFSAQDFTLRTSACPPPSVSGSRRSR